MGLIYQPNGRAREYSPLALNVFTGCDHQCKYCYCPRIMRKQLSEYFNNFGVKNNFLVQLEKDAKQFQNCKSQVLLSFIGDPYCKTNDDLKITRKALEILYKYRIPVALLSKGGSRCLQDLDIFKKFGNHIKVGATLSFFNEAKSLKTEPGAAVPLDRLSALYDLHKAGIRTWVSFEPVLDPDETIELLNNSIDIVDEYKVGKINQYKNLDSSINWNRFLMKAVDILRKHEKDFYVKQDLRKEVHLMRLTPAESNMDLLCVKPFEDNPVESAEQMNLL